MTRKNATSTPAERTAARTAELEELNAAFTQQVATLRTSAGWAAFLKGMTTLHRYSFRNVLLAIMQTPPAALESPAAGISHLAGYRTWQSLGRQVRRGEKGIRILGGRSFERTETDEDRGEETTRKGVRFFPTSVFDIAQTDPIPGATAFVDLNAPLTGEDPTGIYERVATHLAAAGWTITRDAVPGSAQGFTTRKGGDRVVIDERLAPAAAAGVALHEAAHITLGHLDDIEAYRTHRGACEVEAESVAYVVASVLGLDTATVSIPYVAGWTGAATDDELTATGARIVKAAHTLLTALERPASPQTIDTVAA